MMTIKNNKKRILMLLFTFFMLLISLIPTNQITQSVSAGKSPVMRILCLFEDGQKIANLQSTDYFHYLTRSKSAVAETDDVDSLFLNKLLTVAGYDFITPNEVILGREIRPTSIPEEMPDTNQGPKVSAFDRFGVAGLRWSSYQGEWKYNYVEACANQNQVSPTNYGAFYDGRLEPKSTHNEVSTSKDPRTIQFDKGALSSIGSAAIDIFSNGLFIVAKLAVTLTIVFVGLAFTDVTQLIGLSDDGTSGLTASGMFTDIFNSTFTSFILISFLFTALYLLYNGLLKRQLRMAINTLLKTIVIFIIAIIISTDPAYWVGAPNKIANYGQALVLSAMAGAYDNENDQPTLCSTDVASIYDGVDLDLDAEDEESGLMTEFEKLNKNMKSLIGCQMWEQLLFKPWVRGQFGAEYEDLYADKVDNINSSWVGNASVPLGNEETIDNWALFHLSTQTNAHAQIGDSNFPTRVNGVNADWWRVADALSNYDEAETVDSIGDGAYQETYMAPVNSEPTKFWQSWVGNNSTERTGSATIAITFGIAGSVAPFIFSFSSVLFGLGITLLMMTSPLFLLFGTWAGRGQELFNSWLSTLVNTIIKKIAVSILLILSLALTMGTMDLAYSIGIVKSFILMIIVTTLLIKNKDKLLNMMASVDFGGAFDLRTQANQFMNKQNQRAKNTGKVALATAAGAKAGIKSGQGAARGASIGARSQMRNTLYQSTIGMHIIREADIHNDNRGETNCSMCYKLIESKEVAYRDDEGNYYCLYCAEEIGIESLYEVTVGMKSDAEQITPIVEVESTRTQNASKNRSYLSHMKTREIMGSVVIDGKYYWDDAAVQNMAKDNIRRLREDTVVFSTMSRIYGQQSRPPAPPEPLQNYIDIALINKAWTDNQPNVVENTYKEAWKMWYEDNAKHVEGITQEDIDEFKKEIEDYSPDVDIQTSEELIKQIATKNQRSNFTDKDLYIYKNGKLVLNTYDRDVDSKERAKESHQDPEDPEVKKTKKDNE